MHDFDWKEALDHAVTPGDVIGGRYRVDGAIGAGGMGVVLKAWHLVFDARVAIKVLLPERVANAEARARFEREARATFQIRSEHVPRVHDIGTLDAGLPYIVMEYLRGRTLSQLVKERGPLDIPTAVDYLLQACDAVAEAHTLGIVHRDIKPANLFLAHRADGSPCIKVLDFGLAKAGYHRGSLTTVHRSMGTPRYMSPEQWLSARDVGPPTDIWALGATLFEALTGQAPFQADEVDVLCQMVLSSTPPALCSLRPNAPNELDAVLATCLQRNPRHRFGSVAALARSLAEFAPMPHRRLPPSRARTANRGAKGDGRGERAGADWGQDARGANPELRAAPDPTMQDPGPPGTIAVDDFTTAQMARRPTMPDAHEAGHGGPWAPASQPPENGAPNYDPNGAPQAGMTMVDGAPPAAIAEDPVIEWSEDADERADKVTELMGVDQEARTTRMRREDAMALAGKLPKRRRRGRSRNVRKAVGLILLAIAGFVGGALLTKLIRDLQYPDAPIDPAGSATAVRPPAVAPTGLATASAFNHSARPPLAHGGAMPLGGKGGAEPSGDVPDDPPAASSEPETKPTRKPSLRARRADPRVARSARHARRRLSASWQRVFDQL